MMEVIPHSAFGLHPLVVLLAFLLDIAIGDPRWLPHPVRIIGRSIVAAEEILRVEGREQRIGNRFRGFLLVFIVVGSTFGLTWLIVYGIIKIGEISSLLQESTIFEKLLFYCSAALLLYLTSTTIAVRELIDSARVVIESVKSGKIESARKNLSMIVGRDTQNLSEKGILKATIETLSENLSDGIIAPLFYLAIGGLPLAMAYKAVNTLDSMVGYKNEKYLDFGWSAARLDDIANYIPARISGILIIVSAFLFTLLRLPSRALSLTHRAFRIMLQDGGKHPSPNSGIPEAAMAGSLGVKLGGPSTYGGIAIHKPYIGEERTEDYLSASEMAIGIIKVASVIAVGITGVALYARQ